MHECISNVFRGGQTPGQQGAQQQFPGKQRIPFQKIALYFPTFPFSVKVSHTLTMSSSQPSGYRFGATYVGSQIRGPAEAYPLLLADMDPSGNLNANIVHAITDKLRMKMISQIEDSKWQSAQITADYKSDLYTVRIIMIIIYFCLAAANILFSLIILLII